MRYLFTFILLLYIFPILEAQPPGYWHEVPRELRYTPEGDDFVIVNGDRRFNRALYGTKLPSNSPLGMKKDSLVASLFFLCTSLRSDR